MSASGPGDARRRPDLLLASFTFVLLIALLQTTAGAQTLQVEWSTYLGGGAADMGWQLGATGDGEILVVGETYSADFPVTPGAYDTNYAAISEGFFARLSSDGSELLYGSYLGSMQRDVVRDVATDAQGNIYLTGVTSSAQFPTTPDAAFPELTGWSNDAYLVKFDPTGTELLYGTFLGGTINDKARSLALVGPDLVCVTGYTESDDFPVTANAFDAEHNGGWDLFFSCFDLTTGELIYSTYLGGTLDEEPWDMLADGEGCAVVSGYTHSHFFPSTADAFDPLWNGGRDGFLVKMDPLSGQMVWGTFIGGSGYDRVSRISFDPLGNIAMIGTTSSQNFPVTPGAYDTSFANDSDAFIAKLSAAGTELLFSTFVGGSSSDTGQTLYQDPHGEIYFAGHTYSNDFPIVGDVPFTHSQGHADLFLGVLSPSGAELWASSYLGGSSWEDVCGLVVTEPRLVTLTGPTWSDDFPTTSGAFDPTHNGDTDAYAISVRFWPSTGVESPPSAMAPRLRLDLAPSISRATQEIRLQLGARGPVHLELIDLQGRLIQSLHAGDLDAGAHTFLWGGEAARRGIGPGLYFVRARAGDAAVMRKLIRSR